MHILVTGGAGYIGSHTVLELLENNYQVTVIDSLVNASPESLNRVQEITKKPVATNYFDLRDETKLDELFKNNSFDAVIHFAGLKAVGESVAEPLKYYANNLGSTLSLCKVMAHRGVKKLVFSSSATVYGDPARVPITEDFPLQATNPYGQTKLMIEQILQDLAAAQDGWQISLLRYFNPIGAHKSGRIGEDPAGVPNNLLPYVARVAVGKLPELVVHGNDYPTVDGTGVRDYIHVVDLARGHVAALQNLPTANTCSAYNLGTGDGYSVLQVVAAFEQASGKKIAYKIGPRRPGDIAACYADASKAKLDLQWEAKESLASACADAWRWQSENPNGYNN